MARKYLWLLQLQFGPANFVQSCPGAKGSEQPAQDGAPMHLQPQRRGEGEYRDGEESEDRQEEHGRGCKYLLRLRFASFVQADPGAERTQQPARDTAPVRLQPQRRRGCDHADCDGGEDAEEDAQEYHRVLNRNTCAKALFK